MDCIVCRRPVTVEKRTQRKSFLNPEGFEDQLVVIFFFQKFFDVPLLIEDEQEESLESFIKTAGNPAKWVGFCGVCCDMIRRAKGLYKQLTKIEGQLTSWRTRLEDRMWRMHPEIRNIGANESRGDAVRRSLRQKILARRESGGGFGYEAVTNEDEVGSVRMSTDDLEEMESTDFDNVDGIVKRERMEMEPERSPCPTLLDEFYPDTGIIKVEDHIICPDNVSGVEETNEDEVLNGIRTRRRGRKKDLNSDSDSSNKKMKDTRSSLPQEKPPVDSECEDLISQDRLEEDLEPTDDDDDDEDEDYVPEPESSEIREVFTRKERVIRKMKKPKDPLNSEIGTYVFSKGPKRRLRYIPPVSQRTCTICNEVFARKGSLKTHMNSKHLKAIIYTCEICAKKFYTKTSYNSHQGSHLTAEEIKHLALAKKLDAVNIRGPVPESVTLDSESGEQYSEEIVNKVLERTCPICKLLCPTIYRRKHHIESVHAGKAHVCEKCGKGYSVKSSLLKHLKYHDATERIYKCEYPGCPRAFTMPDALRVHNSKVHLKTELGICPHCGQSLTTKSALRRHIMTVHTEDAPRNFQCHICPKTFMTKVLLSQHLKCRSHGGPGLKKRKWIPKQVRLQRKIEMGLIPPPTTVNPQAQSELTNLNSCPSRINYQF